MSFTLRPYQQAAVSAAIEHVEQSSDFCLLELCTGAGKSLIVAEIARHISQSTGKKVLCLAPSKELVEQNAEKYKAYGYPASLFSASAGQKCLKNNVVFGTPQTVSNKLSKFGSQFAAVIIDEAHGITPTIKNIIHKIKTDNKDLACIGLTATPYRLGSGYIYAIDDKNTLVSDAQTRDPYFKKLLIRVTAKELIAQGYLTPPIADKTIATGYDTSSLTLNRMGQFDSAAVDRAFVGHGRLTAQIVADVVAHTFGRRGVMFFAATVQHAHEILASLPSDNAELITGETPKKERENIINAFKKQHFKYLVNVAVLTTGFDAPHVDAIAILRATESASLLQQIIGRGLRLCDGKADCLVMDYAGNIERHGLQDDLFAPQISVSGGGESSAKILAACPDCGHDNEFSKRRDIDDSLPVDKNGYLLDLFGERVIAGDGFMPAHYGRRCQGVHFIGGSYIQCGTRWTHKKCVECGSENDIAAKYCCSCKAEIIDPNEKLRADFARVKRDAGSPTSDKLLAWKVQEWISKKGNKTIRIDWTTEYRTFPTWFSPDGNGKGRAKWIMLNQAVFDGRVAKNIETFMGAYNSGKALKPSTITAAKTAGSDFFEIYAYNQQELTNENTR